MRAQWLPDRHAAAGPLSGRTALITGAASGIGRPIARRFAADGAAVIVVDRAAEPLQELSGEIGARPLVLDLSDIARCSTAAGELAEPRPASARLPRGSAPAS